MVSEPLFSIYFAGELEEDELFEEPQEVSIKDKRRRKIKRRFIGWDYSRWQTRTQVDMETGIQAGQGIGKQLHPLSFILFFDTITT